MFASLVTIVLVLVGLSAIAICINAVDCSKQLDVLKHAKPPRDKKGRFTKNPEQ